MARSSFCTCRSCTIARLKDVAFFAFLAAALAGIALFAVGCASKPGVTALPPLVNYSREFQKELKAELPTVRKVAPRTAEAIKDYSKLRDMIRAGNAVQSGKARK